MAFYDFNLYLGSPVGATPIELNEYVSNVVSKNELSYNASPTRSNDMTLYNDQEAYYVPTVEFTLSDVPQSTFGKLMQIVNSRGFIVEYYDQELGEMVFRSMYATDQSIDALLHTGVTLDGFNGVKVKFVSRYGYPYTPRLDTDHCTEGNKYHMYQLHAHKTSDDFLPMSYTLDKEKYV